MNIIELYVIDGSKWTFIYIPRTISTVKIGRYTKNPLFE